MAEDPLDRLDAHGKRWVPAPSEQFGDRLEAHLRAEHAALSSVKKRRVPAFVPRLALVSIVVAVAIVGALAFGSDDAGVPVAVIEGETPSVAAAPDIGDEGPSADDQSAPASDADPVAASPTVTPTATPQPTAEPTPIPPAEEVTLDTEGETALDTSLAESADEQSATPSESPTTTAADEPTTPAIATDATPSPTSEPAPTTAGATAVPLPSPTPSPSPTPTPTATVEPTATPTPTATPEPEPADLELLCRKRVVRDEVGVTCEWRAPATDAIVVTYEIVRSRNDGDAVVIARQRPSAGLQYIDRDVQLGDTVIYLVRAFDTDGNLVAASVRESVEATN